MTKEEILKNAIVGVVCDELDYEHGNFQFYKEEVLQAMDEYASDLQSENERLKAEREWISVKSKMPDETHDDILVSTLNGSMGVINKFLLTRSQDLYWMPLPCKPKHPKQ